VELEHEPEAREPQARERDGPVTARNSPGATARSTPLTSATGTGPGRMRVSAFASRIGIATVRPLPRTMSTGLSAAATAETSAKAPPIRYVTGLS
jgi:hypothetical protein